MSNALEELKKSKSNFDALTKQLEKSIEQPDKPSHSRHDLGIFSNWDNWYTYLFYTGQLPLIGCKLVKHIKNLFQAYFRYVSDINLRGTGSIYLKLACLIDSR